MLCYAHKSAFLFSLMTGNLYLQCFIYLGQSNVQRKRCIQLEFSFSTLCKCFVSDVDQSFCVCVFRFRSGLTRTELGQTYIGQLLCFLNFYLAFSVWKILMDLFFRLEQFCCLFVCACSAKDYCPCPHNHFSLIIATLRLRLISTCVPEFRYSCSLTSRASI